MNIVITGSGSGIGRAVAGHLGAAGHSVFGLSRSEQESRSVRCDVASWEQVLAAKAAVEREWRHIDALICCAALQTPIGPAVTLDCAEWSRTVRVNLDGTFHCIRAFHEMLLRSPGRARVLCFSGGGAAAPRPNFSAYAVSKAAVVRLVETLAVEWSELPIDINAIAPGGINTRMTEEILRSGPAIAGEKEHARALEQQGRGGAPMERLLGLVDFLLSRDADGISGKMISAPWDDWERFGEKKEALMQSDIYTLRRVTE